MGPLDLTDLTDLTAFVTRDGDRLVTDSRAVAVAFGKQHSHVLRTIEAMLCSEHPLIVNHARRHFVWGSYTAGNRPRSMCRMTQRGLDELTMGFTGQKARLVRLRLIKEFDVMSAALNQGGTSSTDWTGVVTPPRGTT